MKPFRKVIAGTCSALALLLAAPQEAQAAPVVPLLQAIGTAIAQAITFKAIATLVVVTALNFGISKLLAPHQTQQLQERQAQVLQLSLGEGPREAIFGRGVTGGRLLDGFNYGGQYGTDWEVLVIKLADHKVDALEAVQVNDTWVTYSGSGTVSGYNSQLEFDFRPGDEFQGVPGLLTTYGGWASTDNCAGCAIAVVAYRADAPDSQTPTWPGGRPTFKFKLRGKLCYDPRKDSTVAGGSGTHRWATPSTWEWSENAYVCRYNWNRGVYACDRVTSPDQLLIGRGLTSTEAPPDRVAAPANVCDEAITLRAGGTEPRYRAGGVVSASDDFRFTEELFAASMAGQIVQHQGAVEIEPGQNKSAVATITDADILAAKPIKFTPFLTESERINTVISRYIEPAENWEDHAAPIRRVSGDITTDGKPYEETLSLGLVTSGTQAQRCGLIRYKRDRLERQATIPLGPRFSHLEEIDWISWQSDRRHNGSTVVYEIQSWSLDEAWQITLQLREVATTIASWTAATDEIIPGDAAAPTVTPPTAGYNFSGWTTDSPPPNLNLIRNSNFRLGLDSWTQTGWSVGSWANPTSSIGVYAQGGGAGALATLTSDKFLISATNSLTLSQVTANDTGAAAIANITWLNSSSVLISTSSNWALPDNDSFAPRRANTWVAPAGTVYAKVNYIVPSNGSGITARISQVKAEVSAYATDWVDWNTFGAVYPNGTQIAGLQPAEISATLGGVWGTNVFSRPLALTDLDGSSNLKTTRIGSVPAGGANLDSVLAFLGSDGRATSIVLTPNPQLTSNVGKTSVVSPLSATDAGSSATISVAATTLTWLGKAVSYSSGSITGLAFSTSYHVWRNDPTLAGGSATLVATTTNSHADDGNYVWLGAITTPADGGSGTTGDGGGGGHGEFCVAADAFMPDGRRARYVEPGLRLPVLSRDGRSLELAEVESVELALAPAVRLVTEGGFVLTVAASTPITTPETVAAPDPGLIARDCLGAMVPVLDYKGLRWERIAEVQPLAAPIEVVRIHCGGRTYAAGDHAGRFILTHNPVKP